MLACDRFNVDGIADYIRDLIKYVKAIPQAAKDAVCGVTEPPSSASNASLPAPPSALTTSPTLLPTGVPRPSNALTSCTNADWVGSFDKKGWSTCDSGYVITKYQVNDLSNGASLNLLEKAQCCRVEGAGAWPAPAWDQPNWALSLDSAGWSVCPPNEFVAGLRVSRSAISHSAFAFRLVPFPCDAPASSERAIALRWPSRPCIATRALRPTADIAMIAAPSIASKMRSAAQRRVQSWARARMWRSTSSKLGPRAKTLLKAPLGASSAVRREWP